MGTPVFSQLNSLTPVANLPLFKNSLMLSRFLALSLVLLFLALSAQAQIKPIFETEVLTPSSGTRLVAVDLPLNGAKELHLIVSDEGGFSCDWANWIEPKLVMKDGTVKDFTELDWKESKTGYGKTQKNKNVTGGALTVAGKTYGKFYTFQEVALGPTMAGTELPPRLSPCF